MLQCFIWVRVRVSFIVIVRVVDIIKTRFRLRVAQKAMVMVSTCMHSIYSMCTCVHCTEALVPHTEVITATMTATIAT